MKLKKYSVLTQSSNRLTLTEKKIFNYLLYLKQTQNSTNNILYTSLKDINIFLNTKHNNKIILRALETLQNTEITINILNKDKNIPINTSVIPLKSFSFDKSSLIIQFEFNNHINHLNGKDNLYSNLDLLEVSKFKSKYSLILYELINDYKNVSLPKFEITMFNQLFTNNYNNFSLIKKKIIEPAIKEISQKTIFTVNYLLHKLGRRIKFIQFTFTNISRDKEFLLFKKYMLSTHLNKILKINKTNKIIISTNLKLFIWKSLFYNKNKLSFFNKVEFDYYVEQLNI